MRFIFTSHGFRHQSVFALERARLDRISAPIDDAISRMVLVREQNGPFFRVRVLFTDRGGEVRPAQSDHDLGLREHRLEELRGAEQRVLLLRVLKDEDAPLRLERDDAIAHARGLRAMTNVALVHGRHPSRRSRRSLEGFADTRDPRRRSVCRA
jgi:hypothetical protein